MEIVHTGLQWVHIGAGFLGLAAFWVPVFAKKGGTLHIRAGKVFVGCAYAVAASALLGLAIGGGQTAVVLFLGYLSIVTFMLARHAVRVVQTRKAWGEIRTPFHRGVVWAAILGSVVVAGYALLRWDPQYSIILLALSPVGILSGSGALGYMRREPSYRMEWFFEHLVAIFGAGIAFHTAFAVFGATRLFEFRLPGAWQVLPWILPTIVGLPAIALSTRHYRRKFA